MVIHAAQGTPITDLTVLKKGIYTAQNETPVLIARNAWAPEDWMIISLTSMKRLRFFGPDEIRTWLTKRNYVYIGKHIKDMALENWRN